MQRQVFFTILIFALSITLTQAQTANNNCEEVLLKGYLISWYKTNEIAELKNPNQTRLIIDYEKHSTFVPLATDITVASVIDSIGFFNGHDVVRLTSY